MVISRKRLLEGKLVPMWNMAYVQQLSEKVNKICSCADLLISLNERIILKLIGK